MMKTHFSPVSRSSQKLSQALRPLLVGALALLTVSAFAADDGFKPIFDGKSFTGWKSPDMSYWTIEDGAATATSSEEHPCKQNQFLVWQDGEVDDFELKLKFRIQGGPSANSGIQFRGQVNPDGHVIGYQADMDKGPKWLGALYDEHMPRKMLAARGQKTVIDSQGNRVTTSLGDPAELIKGLKEGGWNDYHITAQGSHITIRINGVVTSEVIDNQPGERDLLGVLALQLHSGPPMKVQFKDIHLKRLPLSDGRKKVVFLSGLPSHPARTHEHRAGCWLLSTRLNKFASERVLATAYYDQGWPADPTAFDNADAVVIYSDGNGKHPLMTKLKEYGALHDRGVSLGCIHYAVEMPKGDTGQALIDWTGGVFETYYSVNPHWVAKFDVKPGHPVTRGVKPYEINDEWYYHMRFRDGMEGVTPILQSVPPENTRTDRWGHHHGGNEHVKARAGMSEVTMWVTENENGTRGFGFTGGHYHDNWSEPNHRKVVLNAIAWIAGAEVPITGIPSSVTEEEMSTNLDKKPERKKKPAPKRKPAAKK